MSRRALIIAPTYDGGLCPPISGIPQVIASLERTLGAGGGFETCTLRGEVTERQFRRGVRALFEAEEAALLFFYGHGVVRSSGLTVLCQSKARPDEEGYLLSELLSVGRRAKPKEITVILDCCHAGGLDLDRESLRSEAVELVAEPGRALIAACGARQSSHLSPGEPISDFTSLSISGLAGEGRVPGTEWVTAHSLFTFVSGQLDSWEQDPLLLQHATGQRGCKLTRVPSEPDRGGPELTADGPLLLGLPFAPAAQFIGRETEIEFLRGFLCEGDRPLSLAASVEGLGGVGKTELVLQLLYDKKVRSEFQTVLWFDASAPLGAQWEYFATSTGTTFSVQDHRSAMAELAGARLRAGRVLMVLDNAGDWETLKDLVPPGVALIATTRSRTFGDSSFIHRELTTLADDAGAEFLKTLLPDASDKSLERLAGRLDGHALAIEIAGHYIRDMSTPDQYIEQLDVAAELPVESVAGNTHHGRTLEHCLQIAWDGMATDSARSLWIRASLFAPTSAHRELLRVTGTIGRAEEFLGRPLRYFLEEIGAESAYGSELSVHLIGNGQFDLAYRELRSAHILGRVAGHNGERWSMHRLVRDFGRRRLGFSDVSVHAGILAGWLENPTLPVEAEAPHVIAAALDLPRLGGDITGRRVLGRELLHRGRYWAPSQLGRGLIDHLGEEVNGPHSVSLIFEGIADVNEDVRIAALELLDEIGPAPAVIDALMNTLDDSSPVVRRRAAATIAAHGSSSTMELVEQVIGRSERATRSVLELLGSRRVEDAVPVLNVALQRLDGDLRVEAAMQLAQYRVGGLEVIGLLCGAVAEEVDDRRLERLLFSLSLVTDSDDERVLDSLRRLANGAQSTIALLATKELTCRGEVAYAKQIPVILRTLEAGTKEWRESAQVVCRADPLLLVEMDDDHLGISVLVSLMRELSPDQLEELGVVARDRGSENVAAAIAAASERQEAEAHDPRTPAGSRRAAEIASRLTAAGTPTETPDEVFDRTLSEETEKGSDPKVRNGRAKAARFRAIKDLLASQDGDVD